MSADLSIVLYHSKRERERQNKFRPNGTGCFFSLLSFEGGGAGGGIQSGWAKKRFSRADFHAHRRNTNKQTNKEGYLEAMDYGSTTKALFLQSLLL